MMRKSMFSCEVCVDDGRVPALVDRNDISLCVYEHEGLNVVLKSGTEIRIPETSIEELWKDYQPSVADSV